MARDWEPTSFKNDISGLKQKEWDKSKFDPLGSSKREILSKDSSGETRFEFYADSAVADEQI